MADVNGNKGAYSIYHARHLYRAPAFIFTPTGAARMKISAAFPPVPATPEHIGLAEKFGYSTAWVYDISFGWRLGNGSCVVL